MTPKKPGDSRRQPDRQSPDAPPRDPAQSPEGATPDQDEHVGATDSDVSDRTGPGAGYDTEPRQEGDA